jgi:hypothetical protein
MYGMRVFYRYGCVLALLCGISACQQQTSVRLMVVNPLDSVAQIVTKSMQGNVDTTVHVYRTEVLNQANDTSIGHTSIWHTNAQEFEALLSNGWSNVALVEGFNSEKTLYGERLVANGIHVIARQPLVIDVKGYERLGNMYRTAAETKAWIYELTPERFDSTVQLLKMLLYAEEWTGGVTKGTLSKPAISITSRKQFAQWSNGQILKRPAWFFDAKRQGDGFVNLVPMVDVMNWIILPEQDMNYDHVVRLYGAKRWQTFLNRYQYQNLTGDDHYPDFLRGSMDGANSIAVFSNAELAYTLNGVHIVVKEIWDYDGEEENGSKYDVLVHTERMDLSIKSYSEEQEGLISIQLANKAEDSAFEESLKTMLHKSKIADVKLEKINQGLYQITIGSPLVHKETCLALSVQQFLKYWKEGSMPSWESSFQRAKYRLIMEAIQLASE